MLFSVLLFLSGLLLLYFGAEYLVSGSARIALSFGLRPLILGMTIVAFATSMPEMMVSLFATLQGSSALAAGNIIGSNVANIGLILGAAALVCPLQVVRSALLREIPWMLGASCLLYLLSMDGVLGFLDGLLLFAVLLVFLVYCVRNARKTNGGPSVPGTMEIRRGERRAWDAIIILLGIAGLGVGAELMVRSAVTIAQTLGISELVIGISVVALGTSLPELAASMMGAWKGQMDISFGNVIGSNIFNILFVLGVCSMVRPITIEPSVLRFELPVMLVISFALIPLMGSRMVLNRPRGGLLLASYLAFIGMLFF